MKPIFTASLFLLAVTSFFAPRANAGADCQYRIAGTDPITVTPAGITGKMVCNRAQLGELVTAISKGMNDAKSTDAVVVIGDLTSFWGVRQDLAKALSETKDWDSVKGQKAEGAKGGVVTAEIIPIFDPLFNKHGLRVASANIEQISVEEAAKQGFKDLKGKFPHTGKISLTVTKSSH
ncbi:MAG: hypothetical protein V4760_07455 [Bdellovibrionota bacterium]